MYGKILEYGHYSEGYRVPTARELPPKRELAEAKSGSQLKHQRVWGSRRSSGEPGVSRANVGESGGSRTAMGEWSECVFMISGPQGPTLSGTRASMGAQVFSEYSKINHFEQESNTVGKAFQRTDIERLLVPTPPPSVQDRC